MRPVVPERREALAPLSRVPDGNRPRPRLRSRRSAALSCGPEIFHVCPPRPDAEIRTGALAAGIWQAQWSAAAREAAAAARAVRAVAIASAAGWIRERLRQLSHQQTIAATQRPVPKWRIVWTEQPMC